MQPSPNKQRHKTVLELQMINEQFNKPNLIAPQPWDRRQISRDIPPQPKNKPRPSVLLQELQKADARDFMEDGRETKFYYEKYRTVELCKFMLILMAQGMNILSVYFIFSTFTNETDGSQREVFYYLNEILTLIMLIRIIPMLQTILIFSRFAGARPNRVCSFYGCQGDQLFRIKCMMKKYPMMIFCISYLISLLFFAFAIRICERPLVRIQDEFWQDQVKEAEANGEQFFFGSQDFNNYTVALWMVLITLPTVGYGDRFPRTILGRSITTIMAIVAAFLFSILVNALSNSLELTNNQKKAYTIKRKVNAKKSVNEKRLIIQLTKQNYRQKNINKNQSTNQNIFQ
ncbi:hypothetical protein PPERSA_09482 [Pseudocohnilembus persalinus]|uniref:Potassium channel domain-containing protein n=1 Tax=Pseudocohnilembus persalinus TaxID=266149 RepID=A0A0V0QQW1_PSEPJ|nr:hypothetical protein PPERSA_09482 [Pseudocohnilembus persalinus]|eukprot:KRX04690.1 hypothetical protein PPERSA_09482 [Pseudocohnilembus persalinus]